jgi:hypothetical protein
MSTRFTPSPSDRILVNDVFRRAPVVGDKRAEAEALILRARAARDPGRCPECDAELVPFAIGILRCGSCGIRVGRRGGGAR